MKYTGANSLSVSVLPTTIYLSPLLPRHSKTSFIILIPEGQGQRRKVLPGCRRSRKLEPVARCHGAQDAAHLQGSHKGIRNGVGAEGVECGLPSRHCVQMARLFFNIGRLIA